MVPKNHQRGRSYFHGKIKCSSGSGSTLRRFDLDTYWEHNRAEVKGTYASKVLIHDNVVRLNGDTAKFSFKYPVADDLCRKNKIVLFVLYSPSASLCSLSDTFVSGNFSIVASVSFQIADPLWGRTIATSSFNFASQPSSCWDTCLYYFTRSDWWYHSCLFFL